MSSHHHVRVWVRTSLLREAVHLREEHSRDGDHLPAVYGRPSSGRSFGPNGSGGGDGSHDMNDRSEKEWGWARATILKGTAGATTVRKANRTNMMKKRKEGNHGEEQQQPLVILVQDEDSRFNGMEVEIPQSLIIGHTTTLSTSSSGKASSQHHKAQKGGWGSSASKSEAQPSSGASTTSSKNENNVEASIVMCNHWASAELDNMNTSSSSTGYADANGHSSSLLPPNDLINLTHLHEPAVVYCLRRRYEHDRIYTSTGPILLALNPFKYIPHLYEDRIMGQYWAQGEMMIDGTENDDGEDDGGAGGGGLPPHVYGNADHAFRSMMQGLETLEKYGGGGGAVRGGAILTAAAGKIIVDQSILVSGESGAGKTVTTKHIMRYLATLSQRKAMHAMKQKSAQKMNGGGGEEGHIIPMPRPPGLTRKVSRTQSWKAGAKIEEKILESNPILEAFGNARTVRNDNSSRFGKFIELQFKRTGSLIGASIETYLLEKVRIISQMPGERNYHIFYEMLAGATEDEREKYFLWNYTAEDFKMTSMSGTYDRRDGVDDQMQFDCLLTSMMTMGFSPEEQEDIFAVAIACLQASNLTFVELDGGEKSEVDDSNKHLKAVLSLLGLQADTFNAALCSFAIVANRAKFVRSLRKSEAEKGLEALIKAAYAGLFTHIVRSINRSITYRPQRGDPRGSGKAAYIGVLDIFGFESFKTNSFEQLCINYCNEALQQQFNKFVFKTEQEEYRREGIEWSFIEFPDNQDVLDLIDKKGSGIIRILDDQCRAPGTTDKTFANDIYRKCKHHPRFEANFRQVGALRFGVHHYAGPVEYDTMGFVEKNNDELPREAFELLESSSKPFVQTLAKILNESRGGGGSGTGVTPRGGAGAGRRSGGSNRTTVAGQFTSQLEQLRSRIELTAPHYVRCLKPNDHLQPDDFNPGIIADQLRYAGVLEAVRVSRVGYPQRYTHRMFVQRYRTLAVKELDIASRRGGRNSCEILVNVVALQIAEQGHGEKPLRKERSSMQKASVSVDLAAVGIQIGRTKVFLRQHAFEHLERLRLHKLEVATVRIQATVRRFVNQKAYKRTIGATITVQCCIRRHIATKRVKFLREQRAATIIQSFCRVAAVRGVFLAKKYVARWTQRMQRGLLGRARYRSLNEQRKAVVIQTSWRRSYYRHMFRRKRQCAIRIQCFARLCLARADLKKLKASARDFQAVQNERNELRQLVGKLSAEVDEARKKAADEAIRAAVIAAEKNAKVKEMEDLRNETKFAHAELNRMKAEAAVNAEKILAENEMLKEQLQEAGLVSKEDAEQFETSRLQYENELKESRLQIETLATELEKAQVKSAGTADMEEEIGRVTASFLETENRLKEDLTSKEEEIEVLRQNLALMEAIKQERDEIREELEVMAEEVRISSTKLAEKQEEIDELRQDLDIMKREGGHTHGFATVPAPSLEEMDEMRLDLKQARDEVERMRSNFAEKESQMTEEIYRLEKEVEQMRKPVKISDEQSFPRGTFRDIPVQIVANMSPSESYGEEYDENERDQPWKPSSTESLTNESSASIDELKRQLDKLQSEFAAKAKREEEMKMVVSTSQQNKQDLLDLKLELEALRRERRRSQSERSTLTTVEEDTRREVPRSGPLACSWGPLVKLVLGNSALSDSKGIGPDRS